MESPSRESSPVGGGNVRNGTMEICGDGIIDEG